MPNTPNLASFILKSREVVAEFECSMRICQPEGWPASDTNKLRRSAVAANRTRYQRSCPLAGLATRAANQSAGHHGIRTPIDRCG